jgi:hypothetical protein
MLTYGALGDTQYDYMSISGGGVWRIVLEITHCKRHCPEHGRECSKRILWDTWKHGLHALCNIPEHRTNEG